MKRRTAELTGAALDYAVAIAKGINPADIRITRERLYRWHRNADGEKTGSYLTGPEFLFSTMWEAGGPIIEQEMKSGFDVWSDRSGNCFATYERGLPDSYVAGPTPLIAAMRCYVASKLGDEVEIPEQLLEQK